MRMRLANADPNNFRSAFCGKCSYALDGQKERAKLNGAEFFSQRSIDLIQHIIKETERQVHLSRVSPTHAANVRIKIRKRLGRSAFPRIAARAAKVSVRDGCPRRHAARIFLAARSALMEINGAPAEAANQANSLSCLPLNFAFTCEPVRIVPGATVVTWILSRASSERTASENPVSANLLAL